MTTKRNLVGIMLLEEETEKRKKKDVQSLLNVTYTV